MSARVPVSMPTVDGSAVDALVDVPSSRVAVSDVRVEDRARRAYEGIDTLAASIASLGLLHPIVVTSDLRMIAGGRRLEAVKALGWEFVPVTRVDNITDAADILQAESDENTERMPLKPSEAADLASKIEALLAPMAKDAQGTRSDLGHSPKLGGSGERAKTAAKATGFGAETIRKAKAMQKAVTDESLPPKVNELAKEALAEADRTGKVDGPYKKVTAAMKAADAVKEFPDLAFYFDQGDYENAVRLASALRSYTEPELSMRLGALRATVAAERRKAEAPAEPEGPDYEALAHQIFVAVNHALQTIEKNGGTVTIAAAIGIVNPLAVEMWRADFERIQSVASELLAVTRPRLRRVK